jgi:hypothetical protein
VAEHGEERIHAEFSGLLPILVHHVDVLDSISGEVWEIKPWDQAELAASDLIRRIALLQTPRGRLLQGINPIGMYITGTLILWFGHPVQLFLKNTFRLSFVMKRPMRVHSTLPSNTPTHYFPQYIHEYNYKQARKLRFLQLLLRSHARAIFAPLCYSPASFNTWSSKSSP